MKLMVGKTNLAVLLILILVERALSAAMLNIYASVCNEEEMTLACPDAHKIAIKRIYYGINMDPVCQSQAGVTKKAQECCKISDQACLVFDDNKYPRFNMLCSGYRTCRFKADQIRASDKCRRSEFDQTDFMTVVYDCIQDREIASLCTDISLRGKVLYLSNQNYPAAISGGNHVCECVVHTGFSKGINLHTIDVLITKSEYGNRLCMQSIQILDNYGPGKPKEITCGHAGLYGFRNIYNRPVNNVSLILHSQSIEGRGYFWIQVKATDTSDYVTILCGDAIHKAKMSNRRLGPTYNNEQGEDDVEATSAAVTPRSGGDADRANRSGVWKNFGPIIGGVGAAIFLVSLASIIAIVLFCRKSPSNKRRQATPKMEGTYSPACKGKTTRPKEQNTYCRYDYDEDHYITINRSPMKRTKFATLPGDHTCEFMSSTDSMGADSQDLDMTRSVGELTSRPMSFFLQVPSVPSPLTKSSNRMIPQNTRQHESPFSNSRKTAVKNGKVSFSQPVALVTPLQSSSEESMLENHPDGQMHANKGSKPGKGGNYGFLAKKDGSEILESKTGEDSNGSKMLHPLYNSDGPYHCGTNGTYEAIEDYGDRNAAFNEIAMGKILPMANTLNHQRAIIKGDDCNSLGSDGEIMVENELYGCV